MEWPLKKDGKFTTTPTARSVWKTAMDALKDDDKEGEGVKAKWMAKMDSVKNWRKGYIPVVEDFASAMAILPPDDAVLVAQAGLDALHNTMVFRPTPDSDPVTAREAFFGSNNNNNNNSVPTLSSQVYTRPKGTTTTTPTKQPYKFPLASPTNQWLTGEDAKKQLRVWSEYGCMEPSAAHHASVICDHDNLVNSINNKVVFVLLGATSAMGPAKSLLTIPGAHVLGVARATSSRLKELVQWYEENGAPDTTLEIGGADMIQQGPSIARWIVDTLSSHDDNKKVVLCNLAYMDGEAHVRVSVSMDLIGEYVSEKLGRDRVTLSYLSSPATVYPIPEEAAMDAKKRYFGQSVPAWLQLSSVVPGWLEPTYSWDRPGHVHNGLSSLQGPNYALAKTMQQWRGLVASWKHHQRVSAPHAPPTRSESMVKYDTIASALEGIQSFEPNLSFSVETTYSLMTAILLYHVLVQKEQQDPPMTHPMQLFWDGSVHGGMWRCPYGGESIGTLSYLLGKTMKSPYIPPNSVA